MSDGSDVADRVKKIVVEHLGIDEAKVTGSASLMDDLGADSLDARSEERRVGKECDALCRSRWST
jgi:hypothetical protein